MLLSRTDALLGFAFAAPTATMQRLSSTAAAEGERGHEVVGRRDGAGVLLMAVALLLNLKNCPWRAGPGPRFPLLTWPRDRSQLMMGALQMGGLQTGGTIGTAGEVFEYIWLLNPPRASEEEPGAAEPPSLQHRLSFLLSTKEAFLGVRFAAPSTATPCPSSTMATKKERAKEMVEMRGEVRALRVACTALFWRYSLWLAGLGRSFPLLTQHRSRHHQTVASLQMGGLQTWGTMAARKAEDAGDAAVLARRHMWAVTS